MNENLMESGCQRDGQRWIGLSRDQNKDSPIAILDQSVKDLHWRIETKDEIFSKNIQIF